MENAVQCTTECTIETNLTNCRENQNINNETDSDRNVSRVQLARLTRALLSAKQFSEMFEITISEIHFDSASGGLENAEVFVRLQSREQLHNLAYRLRKRIKTSGFHSKEYFVYDDKIMFYYYIGASRNIG